MAWTLNFLIWITVITTSIAYKYPINPHQLQFAPLPLDAESQNYGGAVPDCKVNSRSPDEVKTYSARPEEPMTRRSANGSMKILSSRKPTSRRGSVGSNQITFPGPTASISREFEPEIPESCQSSTLCDEVINYPQAEIDQLIAEIPDLHRFQLDKLDVPDTPDITQRLGPTEENIELCNSQEKVVYPQGARSSDGKWYTLLNNKDNPVQGFRVEICDQANAPCSDIAVFIPGYQARCIQKYVYRTAAVVVKNPDDKLETVDRRIKVPSCCSCVAKVNIN